MGDAILLIAVSLIWLLVIWTACSGRAGVGVRRGADGTRAGKLLAPAERCMRGPPLRSRPAAQRDRRLHLFRHAHRENSSNAHVQPCLTSAWGTGTAVARMPRAAVWRYGDNRPSPLASSSSTPTTVT